MATTMSHALTRAGNTTPQILTEMSPVADVALAILARKLARDVATFVRPHGDDDAHNRIIRELSAMLVNARRDHAPALALSV
jgi:hypothetical protein